MAEFVELIAGEGQRLLALGRSGPEEPVPQYPGWTITDLLAHTGSILGRTAVVCRDRAQESVGAPKPGDNDDILDWFSHRLDETVEILSTSDHGVPVWGFGPQSNIGSWVTRMLIEVGVHRWDAEQALGRPIPLLDEVAHAGLDEFSHMWLPRLGELSPMLMKANDLKDEWLYGSGDPVYTIEGTGSDLYLRLVNRPTSVGLPDEWAEAISSLEPASR